MIRVRVESASEIERLGLEALLTARGQFVVVSEGPDVRLAVLASGEEPARALARADAGMPALVVLADERTTGWAVRAARSGVRGVLPRTASADAIAAAVEAAALDLLVLPADAFGEARPSDVRAAAPTEALTAREAQILRLLAEGLANKEIAARLGISRHTVKTHLAALFHKLGVSTRAEAVVAGARAGVIVL